ncbi:MAG: hypothetical protein HOV83_09500 [Catenulispora sp.]|nr:hypothetical protein [Catenulispora sp.]
MAVARALVALITAYLPLRLGCTAFLYCREQNSPRHHGRWARIADWIARHPNLFPVGRRFVTSPAALCLLAFTASGAARLLF